jgi:hypothetical protein
MKKNFSISTLLSFVATAALGVAFLASCASKNPVDLALQGMEPRRPPVLYSSLILKDLDDMSSLVQEKIKIARREKTTAPLREGLVTILARSDSDAMLSKVFPPLRNELEANGSYESTLDSIVSECLVSLKKGKDLTAAEQVTYLIVLENLLSEIRPRIGDSRALLRLTERIRDADLDVSEKAKNERSLRVMQEMRSPSEVAGRIIEAYQESKKAEKAGQK